MKASKLYLLVTLVLALFMAVPAMAGVPNLPFTGNVEADFPPGPGILIIEDPLGQDIDVPDTDPQRISGWDLKDLRLAYDSDNDTLYVGINNWAVVGDAEGNGDPNAPVDPTVPGDPEEYDYLGATECVAVFFDLDMLPPDFEDPGSWDVIIGVGSGFDYFNFGIYNTRGVDPPSNFLTDPLDPEFGRIPGHLGVRGDPDYPINPDFDHPDFEFAIRNFSTLGSHLDDPVIDAVIGEFRLGVYEGSADDTSGEEHLFYQQMPSTMVTITPTPDTVFEGGTVSLKVTEHNDSFAERAKRRPAASEVPPEDPIIVPFDFFPANVAVTQNGSGLPWSPLGPPLGDLPDDGDTSDPGVLNQGETWEWTRSSESITTPPDPAIFVAHGSGIDPVGFPHTFVEDPLEEDEVTVDIIVLSTIVSIDPIPATVPFNSTIDLTIRETNDGQEDLTNVQVVVTQDGVPLPWSPLVSPPDSGDTSDPGVLNAGETWVWTRTSAPITIDPTEFVAIGSGDYDGFTVTWCDGPITIPEIICDDQERAVTSTRPILPSTDIDIKADDSDGPIEICEGDPVTLTICEENDSTGDVPLSNVEVDVYYDEGLGEIHLTTLMVPPDSGDLANPGVLDVGEIWCWDYVVPSVSVDTTFIAYGYGEFDGFIITWCSDGPPAPEVFCDADERDPVIVNPIPCRGEGCTPGFWKNNGDKHGASAWCESIDGIPISPSTRISEVFILNEPLVIRGKGKSTITDPTLLQALGANGGGVNAMIRHGIAAMLNACSPCVQYPIHSPWQVIFMIEDALNGVGDYTVDELHSIFAGHNEDNPCPVNQHGDCVGVEEEI